MSKGKKLFFHQMPFPFALSHHRGWPQGKRQRTLQASLSTGQQHIHENGCPAPVMHTVPMHTVPVCHFCISTMEVGGNWLLRRSVSLTTDWAKAR